MFEKAKEFFERDLHYTEIAYQRGIADKDAYWYGITRCFGVAMFLDDPEVNELFDEFKKKYAELPKKYLTNN
jgi:hypothetical protein